MRETRKELTAEIKASSLDSFLRNRVGIIISIIVGTAGFLMFFFNPLSTNKTALMLQEERITAQRTTIDQLTKTQQNDTQEVKLELANLNNKVEDLETNIAQLTTIIDERIPAKK